MFSYRHAFHAGNHADVLKHTTLIAILQHLTIKETALMAFDTHAGAGLYRLDGDFAQTSAEALEGIVKLQDLAGPVPAALQAYLDTVASFNTQKPWKVYPGSPFIIQKFLRERDKLKLYEIHPTDAKTLSGNIAQLEAGRQVAVLREDGFEGVRKLLPPPSRRGLLLCDPSYEMKTDYARVPAMVDDALQRFATGTYAVWYPIIPRPEAHDLPKRLKTMAQRSDRPWLHATLTVKSSKVHTDAQGNEVRPGLPASGMFVINPPHTLKDALKETLPFLVKALGQDSNAASSLDSGS
ncbi:23S rRNA (adenine(2030)-N(6))-methyltransferase RlmJ [Curvibacter sp. APW13]|uniref:23S rRNA (adenine(2030)-N(6))-methyltransferase RlmJ n=1 Tax=Curvibacter sp. APW13 TaxID=3077236 RepID=UPI0028DE26D1|nr:23S rRNA (adenine(2030)-N(6))-methyltransferase RlmJ [Curvibacter sp. APW13]MDT8992972.1 23S rRNA (adenine(2030)-N(6))-methyltransferase RlmJ [Curvibacter sp. APW13]